METLKSITSWIHILSASLSMIIGAVVLAGMKGSARHKKLGILYFYLMLINNITALFIYNVGRFFFPHWLAIVTLLIIIPGFLIAKYKNFKSWLQIHIVCLVVSYYLLIGGAINEAFLRIKILKPFMTDQPLVFSLTHVVAQAFFIGLLIYYLIKGKVLVPAGSLPRPDSYRDT